MFILAQVFGTLMLIVNVLAMQMKDKKNIIFMLLLANLFAVFNFIFLKGYSGAIICGFAIIQTLINNFYEKKGKKLPFPLLIIFIIISIVLGSLTFKNIIDILPIICSVLYSLIIVQSKEKIIRILSLINIILWLIYDFYFLAYVAAISDILVVVSTLIGMYRFDFKKN